MAPPAPWDALDGDPPDGLEPLCASVAGACELAAIDGGVVVVVVGASTTSADVAVPAVQFTDPPPTECQVPPVTWMFSVG